MADLPGRQRDDFWRDFESNQSVCRHTVMPNKDAWKMCEWVPEADRKKRGQHESGTSAD